MVGGSKMTEKSMWNIKTNGEMTKIRELAEIDFPKITQKTELENTSAFFMALADETRLKIIALLWQEDMCMCEIVSVLEAASSTINHHLKIMNKGGVITSRREGKFTIYSLNKEKVTPIISILLG
jgi:DNA-binding transcriptional ArsR family regulator